MEDRWRVRPRAALQSLAQPPNVQVGLFPTFVVVADELLEELADSLELLAQSGAELTRAQSVPLGQLDVPFEPAPISTWSREALASDPLWAQARDLSRHTLAAFAWPVELPDPSHNTYVRG